ncbi:hypothetical protein KQI52_10155 [bacterium]|nr:hypothetical protein [bacterium]
MRARFLLLLVLLLSALVLLAGCEDGEVVRTVDDPLPDAGVFVSDTLDYPQVFTADTSPGGDVFLLGTTLFGASPAENYGLNVLRISPYGETLFETDGEDFIASDIHATVDYGCVGSGTPTPLKYNSEGGVDWLLDIPATSTLPRPDGSVILAGHEGVEDTLIHVTAVNALGVTLWSTSFEREPHELAVGAARIPNGDTALLLQTLSNDDPISPIPITGVRIISADGSTQQTRTIADPEFVSLVQTFVALADGGFAAFGVLEVEGALIQNIMCVWDASGAIAWQYTNSELEYSRHDIEPASDNGLLLLTQELSAAPIRLRRFDAAGNIIWTREYGETFPHQGAIPLDVAILDDNLIQLSYYMTTASLTKGQVVIVREEMEP